MRPTPGCLQVSGSWAAGSFLLLPKARSTVLLLLFSALALLAPSLAAASTTLGPVPTNPGPESSIQAINWPDSSLIFTIAGPAGQQLTAPEAGTITSWNLYTDDVGTESSVQLRVLSHVAGNEYKVVGSGPVQPIDAVSGAVAKKNALHTFAVSVPIAAGQMVGVTLFRKNGSLLEPALPAVEGQGWQYGCLTCESGPIADGESATTSPIPSQWVALTAEIGGGGGQGGCVGSACTTAPGVAGPGGPAPAVTKKKCKKGKRLKHGKCVKKKRHKNHGQRH